MPRYIALLRAINVGGARTVKMAMICQLFEGMGFSGVASYIASGNIIFSAPSRDTEALEDRIDEGLMQALGYEVTPFVRTVADLGRIAAFKPFPRSKFGARDQLGIIFLHAPSPAKAMRALKALQMATDEFRVAGREIYWLRHRGPGGEVYTTAAFDKLLDQPFTIRSVNTISKIVERYGQHE